MRKQSTFEKLDLYLDGKTPNEVTMYNVLAFLLCCGLMYFLVFPIAQQFFDDKTSENSQITQKLDQTNRYLMSVSNPQTLTGDRNYQINKRSRELMGYNKKLKDLIDYNNYFSRKLQELSTLTYDGANWSNFMDRLTNLAKKYSVQINSITSEVKEVDANKVVPILDIGVSFNGRFDDVLRYINAIEESKLIVDINYFDLNSTSSPANLKSHINIAIWGMRFE